MSDSKTITLEKVYKKLGNLEKRIKKIETKTEDIKKKKTNFFLKASESSTKFWDNKEDAVWDEL